MYSAEKPKISAAETKALGERIAAYLRRRHPSKTAFNVAADLGLPVGTVAKWIEGAATPNLFAGLKLVDVYGAEFIGAAWPHRLGFLSTAARAEAQRKLDEKIAELQARRDELDA